MAINVTELYYNELGFEILTVIIEKHETSANFNVLMINIRLSLDIVMKSKYSGRFFRMLVGRKLI